MKKFKHINAYSIDEAVSFLGRYGKQASVIAGGTDLIGKMKDEILPDYPEAIINIKTIPELDCITEQEGVLTIGALTRLHDIAINPIIIDKYSALAQAAQHAASPNIRQMGTIGGNICQDIRCWYYRNPRNRFPCLRKGGGRCYAIEGDNRYHSIFGGSVEGGCYAVHPSDTAPALIALGARVKTSKRTIDLENFFTVAVAGTTILEPDEFVTHIQVPAPAEDGKSAFIKFAMRKSIDFPIVNCAVMINKSDGKVVKATVCLNAVFLIPLRMIKAEEVMLGKTVNESQSALAGKAAVSDAMPMKHNKYMVKIAETLAKRSILNCK